MPFSTVGQDGLVANVARYVGSQPIVAVNPDPERFDGVLLPFELTQARKAVNAVIEDRYQSKLVTLAEAELTEARGSRRSTISSSELAATFPPGIASSWEAGRSTNPLVGFL